MDWRQRSTSRRRRTVRDIEAEYRVAFDAPDAAAAERLAREAVGLDPSCHWALFDLGLFAKRRRDWPEAVRLNRAALDVETDAQGDPAAWNLGIAATALRDWATARTAWRLYGIELPDGSGPIEADFGPTPIRLNPEPRHLGETPFLLDGVAYGTEVVWARRLCPARARILSVPLPESGHRHGDVVLHDGEPVGSRQLGDSRRPVFNELVRLVPSPHATWTCSVAAPEPADGDSLAGAFDAAHLAAEDWTSSVTPLCKACSEGDPDQREHDHVRDAAWVTERHFGLAGGETEVEALLREWALAGQGRGYADLDLAL